MTLELNRALLLQQSLNCLLEIRQVVHSSCRIGDLLQLHNGRDEL